MFYRSSYSSSTFGRAMLIPVFHLELTTKLISSAKTWNSAFTCTISFDVFHGGLGNYFFHPHTNMCVSCSGILSVYVSISTSSISSLLATLFHRRCNPLLNLRVARPGSAVSCATGGGPIVGIAVSLSTRRVSMVLLSWKMCPWSSLAALLRCVCVLLRVFLYRPVAKCGTPMSLWC